MFSTLISFLASSIFRTLWGEITSFFNKKQDHEHEIERMKLQGELDEKAHERTMANIRLQHDLKVEQVVVERDAALQVADAGAFADVVKDAFRPTGYALVDVWNGVIRPQFAQIALALWFAKVVGQGFVMDDHDRELVGAILGFFVADRSLLKRGK